MPIKCYSVLLVDISSFYRKTMRKFLNIKCIFMPCIYFVYLFSIFIVDSLQRVALQKSLVQICFPVEGLFGQLKTTSGQLRLWPEKSCQKGWRIRWNWIWRRNEIFRFRVQFSRSISRTSRPGTQAGYMKITKSILWFTFPNNFEKYSI